ncbi:hypothetical protein C6P45_002964 [Maudiozyma exigua]|uniref:Uncharacterized protein n=1 Tax=Maudiozyma exigua TaxID=34358 RepID=A0A9P6WEF2_MAUEX|nr:hypothetical protein C6P45_002964 [Kazachstania exigua]
MRKLFSFLLLIFCNITFAVAAEPNESNVGGQLTTDVVTRNVPATVTRTITYETVKAVTQTNTRTTDRIVTNTITTFSPLTYTVTRTQAVLITITNTVTDSAGKVSISTSISFDWTTQLSAETDTYYSYSISTIPYYTSYEEIEYYFEGTTTDTDTFAWPDSYMLSFSSYSGIYPYTTKYITKQVYTVSWSAYTTTKSYETGVETRLALTDVWAPISGSSTVETDISVVFYLYVNTYTIKTFFTEVTNINTYEIDIDSTWTSTFVGTLTTLSASQSPTSTETTTFTFIYVGPVTTMTSITTIPTTETETMLETKTSTTLETVQTETGVPFFDVVLATIHDVYTETVESTTTEAVTKLETNVTTQVMTETIVRTVSSIPQSESSHEEVISKSSLESRHPASSMTTGFTNKVSASSAISSHLSVASRVPSVSSSDLSIASSDSQTSSSDLTISSSNLLIESSHSFTVRNSSIFVSIHSSGVSSDATKVESLDSYSMTAASSFTVQTTILQNSVNNVSKLISDDSSSRLSSRESTLEQGSSLPSYYSSLDITQHTGVEKTAQSGASGSNYYGNSTEIYVDSKATYNGKSVIDYTAGIISRHSTENYVTATGSSLVQGTPSISKNMNDNLNDIKTSEANNFHREGTSKLTGLDVNTDSSIGCTLVTADSSRVSLSVYTNTNVMHSMATEYKGLAAHIDAVITPLIFLVSVMFVIF